MELKIIRHSELVSEPIHFQEIAEQARNDVVQKIIQNQNNHKNQSSDKNFVPLQK